MTPTQQAALRTVKGRQRRRPEDLHEAYAAFGARDSGALGIAALEAALKSGDEESAGLAVYYLMTVDPVPGAVPLLMELLRRTNHREHETLVHHLYELGATAEQIVEACRYAASPANEPAYLKDVADDDVSSLVSHALYELSFTEGAEARAVLEELASRGGDGFAQAVTPRLQSREGRDRPARRVRRPQDREVRALYDDDTVTVYQAYSDAIADAALAAGTFAAPFKTDRMTWVKPSLSWMLHRSGKATKPDQTRILAVRLTRDGFETALRAACLSSFDPTVHDSEATWRRDLATNPVRVQWDPERNRLLEPLDYRTIQIGIPGSLVPAYVHDWIVDIDDVTTKATEEPRDPYGPARLDRAGWYDTERSYPVPPDLRAQLGICH